MAAKCHLMRVTGALDDHLEFQAAFVITQSRACNTGIVLFPALYKGVTKRLGLGSARSDDLPDRQPEPLGILFVELDTRPPANDPGTRPVEGRK